MSDIQFSISFFMEESMLVLNATSDSPNTSNLLAHLPGEKWYQELDVYLWKGFWYL